MTDPVSTLLPAAKSMLTKSYAPHSGFFVGSAILTQCNQLYTGCNIENASFGMTLCAETSAIAQMISHIGAKTIAHVMVLSSSQAPTYPCGACLQRLLEFADHNTQVYLAHGNNYQQIEQHPLAHFLPFGFALPKDNERNTNK